MLGARVEGEGVNVVEATPAEGGGTLRAELKLGPYRGLKEQS